MMELSTIVILSVGLGAVLASAVPQGGGFGHLNAFVSAASIGGGPGEPLATSASETRFRFGGGGSGQGKSTSDRRLFIPGLDRRERKPTGLLTGSSSVIGAPPKTTKIPTTTPSSKPKPIIKSHDNKFSDDYYYADDEYYYDYYYYDDIPTEERKIGPLGALDPPSAAPTRPTTQSTQASTTSRPFRFDFNNKLRERPSLISSRTTPLPTRTSSKSQSTRPSLAALLLKRIKAENQENTPVNNDLTGENREPRVIEETHTEKEEMQVHVTTNTESSRVVSSIKSSHSITSEDPTLTTPTQPFVGETTTNPTPSSTSEVTELSTTSLPETTSKRSLADISETVDIESFLTGNVNSEDRSLKSLDDTQININVDILATEKKSETIQTTTTTSTVATPKIESLDVKGIFETLLRKQAEAKTEVYPSLTEKNKLGSLLDPTTTTTPEPTTTTTSTPIDAKAFFESVLRNKPYKKPEAETTTTIAPTTTTVKNTEKSDENIFDLFPAIQPANVSSFLPPGYKPVEEQNEESSTKKADVSSLLPEGEAVNPLIKTVDVSAFLPPGYKPPADAKPPVVETLDVSDFLPPNYKPQGPDSETTKKKVEIEFVDMSSFLTPDYKSPGFEESESIPEKTEGPPVIKQVDVSAFLPPGFKIKEEDESVPAVPAIKQVDVSAFLPPGFKLPKDEKTSPASGENDNTSKTETTEPTTTTTKKGPKGLKFPKRPDRPAFLTTTAAPQPSPSGPPPVKPTIRNIFANRAVTKAFTGWGFTTQPTVPKPVIKAVDPSSFLPPGFKTVDISSFLPPGYKPPEGEVQEDIPFRSTPSTKPPTTSTTTTTTTTPYPTTPGVCGSKCRLFATIKITNGTQWYPELANRDTIEWQQLANSIEIELDALYRSGPLAPWYEGVTIDGFHKGSVIVDYYLQLREINENKIATTDLKEILNRQTSSDEGHILGNYTLDSSSTDFIVRKEKLAKVLKDDNGYLLPQWLIAVIVIGLASLLFILIFGITVLVNRSRVNKRHNVPLTEEMLNELNKSHMGGFGHGGHHNMVHGGVDNYALDAGLYDMDAVWNDKRMDRRMIKPPSSQGKGYNPNYNINIYDSWRTDWSGPYGSSATYAKRPRTDTNF